jgi:hypothetical protein
MPQSHDTHQKWLQKTVEHVENNPKDLHPAINDFKHAVESDTRLTMLFASMFEQVPHKAPYQKDPTGTPQVSRDRPGRFEGGMLTHAGVYRFVTLTSSLPSSIISSLPHRHGQTLVRRWAWLACQLMPSSVCDDHSVIAGDLTISIRLADGHPEWLYCLPGSRGE